MYNKQFNNMISKEIEIPTAWRQLVSGEKVLKSCDIADITEAAESFNLNDDTEVTKKTIETNPWKILCEYVSSNKETLFFIKIKSSKYIVIV